MVLEEQNENHKFQRFIPVWVVVSGNGFFLPAWTVCNIPAAEAEKVGAGLPTWGPASNFVRPSLPSLFFLATFVPV